MVCINYKCILFIDVSNPYVGDLLKPGYKLISIKRELSIHGFGLDNVRATVEKYNGSIDINPDNHIFKVLIGMYV